VFVSATFCIASNIMLGEPSKAVLASRAKSRRWKKNNRELWLQSKRRYYRKKMQDPGFVLENRLRSRVRKLFHKWETKRTNTTITLLGTSVENAVWFLNAFSEHSLNTPGIEVDHVRPVSSYNLLDPIEQLECFSYANMQLLPGLENRVKCDKFTWENYAATMHADLAYELRYNHHYWNYSVVKKQIEVLY
jgi:hypothetical protein